MLTKNQLIQRINELEVEKIKLMGQVEYIDAQEREKAEEAKAQEIKSTEPIPQ